MPSPDRIERTIDLAYPPERVWAAITTAEGLGTWLGAEADVDLRPGGEARVRFEGHPTSTLVIHVVDEPRQFAFTWPIEGLPGSDPRRTYVEFLLEPDGAGTRLTLTETGFAQAPAGAAEGNADGWRIKLAELAEYLDAAALAGR
jgi:uncharacterized protein YndB with AHSA1/START domain